MNPPVVNLASDDEENEPAADDTTSVLPSASISSQHGQSTTKRRHFGGPKKKSSVWNFLSKNEAGDVVCCASCDYVLTPSGHTGNAVTHLKNIHADTFTEYEREEKARKKKKKKTESAGKTKLLVQPKIKFQSSDPHPEGSLR